MTNEEYYRCYRDDFPPVPCDEAIFQVSKLLAADGPDSFGFLGYDVYILRTIWTIIFGDGELCKAIVAPCELSEAVVACKYFDELPPIVAWDKNLQNYRISRRGQPIIK